jgi:hypothetical protein
MSIPKYRDHTGAIIVLSQGISETNWGAFQVKPNGSLRRLRGVEMTPFQDEAEGQLAELAERKNWEPIADEDYAAACAKVNGLFAEEGRG